MHRQARPTCFPAPMRRPNELFRRQLTEPERAGLRPIGRSLRRGRHDLGWTQHQLEQVSGVDQTIISRLENGRLESLKLRKLAAIARALKGAGAFPFD